MTAMNVFSISFGLSLSFSHTHIHTHTRLIISFITFSPSLALIPFILSEILIAKATRRVSCDSILTHFLWRDIHTTSSFFRLVVISTTYSTSIYIFIYLYVYQVKATSVFNIKSLTCLSKVARTKIVRYDFAGSK